MVQRRDTKPPTRGEYLLRSYGTSSLEEIDEAKACAAYDYRCPRCGAEVDGPCLAQVGEVRPLKHPHAARLALPTLEDIVAYLAR